MSPANCVGTGKDRAAAIMLHVIAVQRFAVTLAEAGSRPVCVRGTERPERERPIMPWLGSVPSFR